MRYRLKTAFCIAASFGFLLAASGEASRFVSRVSDDELKTDTVSDKKVAEDAPANENSIIDEVVWVVGDEAILKSDVEAMRIQGEMEGMKWNGDPDCIIPEQLAVQKLFLHQAALDSIEVTESDVSQSVDQQINYWISNAGSREKLEEWKKMTVKQMKESLRDDFRNHQLIEKMKSNLVKDIKVSPADVRRYFEKMPQDSLPLIPTEVEVEIITQAPRIAPEEINRIKNELRDYTERVTKGETSFAALARLYSEDPGTARQGGEFDDYVGRGMLDPAFASVAFNLTDPKKISKIVESEYGYHIIQLIDKRGDKIKVRHILRVPRVSPEALEKAENRLDSIADDIRANKFTFEAAASYLSDDKDTKNNNGLMANQSEDGFTSKFRMRDLPTEIARVVDTLKVGEISKSFRMVNSKGKTVCVIAKLVNRIDAHRATITEDFQAMKAIVQSKRRADFLKDWIQKKIKTTYIRINDKYKNCNFEYEGWVK
ncbi:peptidylprolyl isomerase [Prevotella sp.]|jgi:peptidyl-prolyl cis-trans isomerase SurA|uniref:peptidylprolyl isomerase n=1 Tax=uncultured Prevotella sp. TaxID=159272 RepID=UPI0026274CAC|nr:peptidylprolyl isomerase [uncultured Prevotella sp.]